MSDHDRQPRLESPYFGAEGNLYARMARVLDYSARRHCPRWVVNVWQAEPEPLIGEHRETVAVTNTQKLGLWCRAILEAPVGDRICLIDSDTFVVNGLDGVWDRDFDIAITVRDFTLPLNAGVVFVRVTPQTKTFMQRWSDVTMAMYADIPYHKQWMKKYGGMTQASLGSILESDHGLNVLTLPCREWNCEDSCFGEFDPAVTRVVHVKSGLRRLIFYGDVRLSHYPGWPQNPELLQYPGWTNEDLAPLARHWLALEQELEQEVEQEADTAPSADETTAPLAGAGKSRGGVRMTMSGGRRSRTPRRG